MSSMWAMTCSVPEIGADMLTIDWAMPVTISDKAGAAIAQPGHGLGDGRGGEDTQVRNDGRGIARREGALDAVFEQDSHISGVGGDRVGGLAANIDYRVKPGMLLVEEVGGVFGNIGHGPGPQCNESFAMFNVRLYKVNLVKASMHQAVLIAFEPQCFNLVAGIVQQRLYKRFQVLLLTAHG